MINIRLLHSHSPKKRIFNYTSMGYWGIYLDSEVTDDFMEKTVHLTKFLYNIGVTKINEPLGHRLDISEINKLFNEN